VSGGTETAERPALGSGVKLLAELGPLAIFFIVNSRAGIVPATAAFLPATLAAIAFLWWRERKLPVMPVVNGVFVAVFGGLTVWLNDADFIKMKPTVIFGFFAAVLLIGLAFGRGLLKIAFGAAMQLDEPGWRGLSLRWGLFFAALALANEVLWRQVSTDAWVNFKVFGIMPLTFAFALLQMRFIQRHSLEDGKAAG